MAYTPCPSAVTENGIKNCESVAYGGLKVMAVMFEKSAVESIVRGTGAGKNLISAITLKSSAKTIIVEAAGADPWAGTNEEFDQATQTFTKTATFLAPQHGGGFSGGFVEPVLKNRDGYVVVLQRKDDNGDMAFPIIGLERGAVGSAGTLDYNDNNTGGCYTLTLTETGAASSEITLFDTDMATTKELFDGLVGKSV